MSINVIRELEELRSMLDTPKKTFTPAPRFEASSSRGVMHYTTTTNDASPPPATPSGLLRKDYGYALNSAEKSVDRLGRAIEAAEEEMEAALKRTTEVHRSQLRQKEVELHELGRLMAAKERSIESLRETLSTTKRSYESRLSQAEASLALKEAEASSLHEELRATRQELESVQLAMRRDLSAQGQEIQELQEHERELQASSRSQAEEVLRLTAQVRGEREERRLAVHEAEEQRRQAEVMAEELRVVRHGAANERDSYRSEISDLKRRLRGERSIRKACEKWLRAELRSREEYDMLLRAIRETAHGSGEAQGAGRGPALGLGSLSGPIDAIVAGTREVQEVELLLHKLKVSAGVSSPPPGEEEVGERRQERSGGRYESPVRGAGLVQEAELARRRMEDDNKRLQAELLAAKKLLQEQRVQRLL